MATSSETIYLAGGCFWGVEAYFKLVNGIIDTEVGYCGGNFEDPTYNDVTTGITGHAETTKVIFDPSLVSLEDLLKHFWRAHNPTSLNKQGNDIGSQYRSAIFYVNDEQKEVIENSLNEAQKTYEKPIVTEISPFKKFFKAEEYHQDYLAKNPFGYCHIDLKLAQKPLR
ncbi:MAG: hypothetical protein Fur003_1970 [Candidatus Dojkabacteria bacterium]